MTPESILSQDALILPQESRESYFENGYVLATGFLQGAWLERMQNAYLSAVERSRSLDESNQWFSLQPDHNHDRPRIHRIERLPDQDPEFWNLVTDSEITQLAADIVGPDVVYRDSMINVKSPGSGGSVAWHQDLPFYPHTNTSTIQILIALYDVPLEQGPLTLIQGSHKGEIFEHYDETNQWTGKLRETDKAKIDLENAVTLPCNAGDAIILHPLTLHSSGPNQSNRNRPYLIHGMSSADSISYTAMTWGNSHTGELVRGKPARYAHHEDMVIPLPPDWSDGYTSIFEHHRRDNEMDGQS
ncbi:MAG: phytanoyl-CoA dioxygenase family protein [Pseudomonadota bacterium]